MAPATMTPPQAAAGSRPKTRLVLVHDSIGGTTGMGRVTAAMARIAREAGWSVTLVGTDVDNSLPWAEHVTVAYRHRLPSLLSGLWWVAAAARRLRKEDFSDAVVHVHAPLLMHFADLFTCHHLAEGAARHGLREPGTGVEGFLRRRQESLSVKLDSLSYRRRPARAKVTFVSEFLRAEFTDLYGSPNGGEILPPPAPPWDPISPDERAAARTGFELSDGDVVVGYLGGNDARKGVSQVVGLANDGRYVVLGAGPKSEELWFGKRRGVGYVNVRTILAACDVVVAPTLFDAAPVAVLEAVAAGLPVVTGESSGWAEPLRRFGAGTSCRVGDTLGDAVAAVIPGSASAAKAFTDHYSYRALARRLTEVWQGLT